MALRDLTGIPIDVPVSSPGISLQNAFRSATSPILPITRRHQKAGAWCYAACAQMVINYSHGVIAAAQCQIASFVKKGSTELNFCCTTGGFECIRTGCQVPDVARIFDFWKVLQETSGIAANPVLGQVNLAKLTSEFEAGRPVEVVVDWDNGGSHALLVTGVSGNWIFLIDPLEDDCYGGWRTVPSLQGAFGFGLWTFTWPGLSLLSV
jgi:hypothetical protein